MTSKKRVLLVVLMVTLSLSLIEIVLTIATWVSPMVAELLASPIRGRDSQGFRNPVAYREADVVAFGDSQTYGTGVELHEAWPRQLESMMGCTVYSMAYGGYGPVKSLLLWDRMLALNPKIVIEAFYAGNDLYDSFDAVYNHGRLPELKSAVDHVQEAVRKAEKSGSIAQRADWTFQRITTSTLPGKEPATSIPRIASLQTFLSRHWKMYALLSRVRFEFTRYFTTPELHGETWESAKAFAEKNSAYRQVFTNGQFRTIFTSEYRLLALNLQDARIAEGHQISLRAIRKMNELSSDKRIRFLVALIPTKEFVFRELWRNPSNSFFTLTENEEQFWNFTKEFFDHHGIEYVDVLPALRERLSAGIQPYPITHDGHPNPHGHIAIAKSVAAYLRSSSKPEALAEPDAPADVKKPCR